LSDNESEDEIYLIARLSDNESEDEGKLHRPLE